MEPSPAERQPLGLIVAAIRDRDFLLGLWLMTVPCASSSAR
jgi:hypothetical protein